MSPLTPELLRKFLVLAGDRLEGEWLLVGGTVLPLLGVCHRATLDIDLVCLGEAPLAQTLTLMKLADELGLPVEAINQAAAYFVEKIGDYHKHMVTLHRGDRAVIHRPDLILFLKLKIGRLNETDLADCLAFLEYHRHQREPFEREALESLIQGELKGSIPNTTRHARLATLVNSIKMIGTA